MKHGDALDRALTNFSRDPIDKLELFRVDDERIWERREAAPPKTISLLSATCNQWSTSGTLALTVSP